MLCLKSDYCCAPNSLQKFKVYLRLYLFCRRTDWVAYSAKFYNFDRHHSSCWCPCSRPRLRIFVTCPHWYWVRCREYPPNTTHKAPTSSFLVVDHLERFFFLFAWVRPDLWGITISKLYFLFAEYSRVIKEPQLSAIDSNFVHFMNYGLFLFDLPLY